MNSHFLAKFMNVLVILFLVIMVFTLCTLPILVDKYLEISGVQPPSTLGWIKVLLYLTALPFFVLLIMCKKLCENVLHYQPFSLSSIRALNVISLCAFVDFLLYAIGTIIILRNLLSFTLMVAAFMVGLVSLILSQLIKLAMEIKEEYDLTI